MKFAQRKFANMSTLIGSMETLKILYSDRIKFPQ